MIPLASGGKYTDWDGGVRTNAWVSGGFVPAQRLMFCMLSAGHLNICGMVEVAGVGPSMMELSTWLIGSLDAV